MVKGVGRVQESGRGQEVWEWEGQLNRGLGWAEVLEEIGVWKGQRPGRVQEPRGVEHESM